MRILYAAVCLGAVGCPRGERPSLPTDSQMRLGQEQPSQGTASLERAETAQIAAAPAGPDSSESEASRNKPEDPRVPAETDTSLAKWGLALDCTVLDFDDDGNEIRKDTPPCERGGDFDGDGTEDSLRFVRDVATGRRGFLLLLSTGKEQVLGAGQLVKIESADPEIDDLVDDDYSWFMAWEVAKRRGASIEVRIGPRPRRIPAPRKAKGDAIMISGGDAAALVYYDGTTYRIEHLGF